MCEWSGGWFNIKMPSYEYMKSHCGDKAILRPSYLHNGISCTGKKTSLYWIRAPVVVGSDYGPGYDLLGNKPSHEQMQTWIWTPSHKIELNWNQEYGYFLANAFFNIVSICPDVGKVKFLQTWKDFLFFISAQLSIEWRTITSWKRSW